MAPSPVRSYSELSLAAFVSSSSPPTLVSDLPLDHFQQVLATDDSSEWTAIANSSAAGASSSSPDTRTKGTGLVPSAAPSPPGPFVQGLAPLDPSQVRLSRRYDPTRKADLVRAVSEVPCDPTQFSLDAARAVLSTPELRPHWDKLVDSATGLVQLDPRTAIVKTDYRLGWPASPRDTVTIARTFDTERELIQVATSLPRAADEPAFLRPAPPFVRAHTHLAAWCFQVVPPSLEAASAAGDPASTLAAIAPVTPRESHRLRITVYWQWNLRLGGGGASTLLSSATALPSAISSPSATGSSVSTSAAALLPAATASPSTSATAHTAHLPALISSLVGYLRFSSPGSGPLPLVTGYGAGVEMNRDEWDPIRERRNLDYAVVATSLASSSSLLSFARDDADQEAGLRREGDRAWVCDLNRLERALEISLPAMGIPFAGPVASGTSVGALTDSDAVGSGDGWDVRILVKALGGGGGGGGGGGAGSTAATPVSTPGLVGKELAFPPVGASTGSPATVTKRLPDIGAAAANPEPPYSVSLTTSPVSLAAANPSADSTPSPRLKLRIEHPPLRSQNGLLRVSVTIQRSTAGGKRVRVNGEKVDVRRDDAPGMGGASRSLLEVAARAGAAMVPNAAEGKVRLLEEGDASPAEVVVPRRPSTGTLEEAASVSSAISLSPTVATTSANPRSNSPAPSSAVQIASLLRRSYIYFLSLLQEPPAKWRHVTDSAGVSVTQLLSPDPTLTIYRAEAVFVGVGVWDAFATVVTPGVRRTWDKNVDGVTLIADEENGAGAGELSEVWWERRKGIWPVSARDSVLLRTAYKSPSSVHIFSSSTDNTSLFPSIPSPADGTIRIQTDLYGWSIEALSPTTTQITLLDQSDPKGWSSKSAWTPQALVQAVAGVRDYSLKNGAPPVVTRLSGKVRKTSEEYDPDKAALRVSFAPIPGASGAVVDEFDSMVECEIRCDATTWAAGAAGGVDVVVDPPPSNVSCLLRHRLSAGGGLWLTIEHARSIVAEEGRVSVTVRKGLSTSSAGDRTAATAQTSGSSPTVIVNGARIKVDVEVLDDDKVRELEKRKRVKAAPVPLDQYETLGPRHGQPAATRSAPNAVSLSPSDETGAVGDAAALGQEKGLHALGKAVPPIEGAAVSSGDAAVSASEASSSVPTVVPGSTGSASDDALVKAPKPPLDPPACALEALAWLQTFHAEQGPELTDPAPGWTNVSERGGVVVRKKLLPRISPTISVYRGDKIVQGLTADEIASIVTSPSCRRAWDDRVDSAVLLSSYGHGISTMALTTKPTFPFRGRIFRVATANAAVKVPSASSGASTSTVLFVASASYTPRDEDPFDPAKLNPLSLPMGQVLLEGWILETLDPYTSSVLAIPSTRCTFVSCTDQKGSVPLALNTTLNANLARALSSVEQFGKSRGPLPRIWTPPLRLQIEGPLGDDSSDDNYVWRLETSRPAPSSPHGDAVIADYSVVEASFRAVFKVSSKPEHDGPASTESRSSSLPPANNVRKPSLLDKGAGKSKPPPLLSPPLGAGQTMPKSELPRAPSLNLLSSAPPLLHKAPIMSELSRKSSHNSLRAAAAASASSNDGGAGLAKATATGSKAESSALGDPADHDLLVAEIVVDLKQYPHGYSVTATSQILSTEDEAPLSLDPVASVGADSHVPAGSVLLRCVAHDAPLPSILTASLDAWKRANHLVRILVPTGAITHPLKDPLRSEDSASAGKKPDWYTAFAASEGALVDVAITALPAPQPTVPDRTTRAAKDKVRETPESVPVSKVTGQANKTVVFNREKLVVLTQKEGKTVLARFDDDDAPLTGAKISRVSSRPRRKSIAAEVEPDRPAPGLLPAQLQRPLAQASRLYAPKPVTPLVDDFDFPDPKSPGTISPANEEARSPTGGAGKILPAAARRDTVASTTTTTTGGPLLSLLSGYPLGRLTTNMLASTVDVTETSATGVVAVRRTYTLSFVLVVAIIAFLIGSLLRSLLTPADYIIYRPESAVEHSQVEHALLSALDVNRRWREARRLLELRGLFGWDLMLAAVKRE
ncbi:hypothetical protein BMF94_2711 [Rhodotorula taiwanensis]|uniref:START domain-containing protein n=1 Tax=Rhodotorula taiwanensis TaxID=741276 RepID=A0A2S5BBZ3_9BASI|nr:hypothetical protein BMF94_2711 [Rhodotorula taiwanensis]